MFNCIKNFIYAPKICVQDKETVFTKTFKTFGVKYMVSRGENHHKN